MRMLMDERGRRQDGGGKDGGPHITLIYSLRNNEPLAQSLSLSDNIWPQPLTSPRGPLRSSLAHHSEEVWWEMWGGVFSPYQLSPFRKITMSWWVDIQRYYGHMTTLLISTAEWKGNVVLSHQTTVFSLSLCSISLSSWTCRCSCCPHPAKKVSKFRL